VANHGEFVECKAIIGVVGQSPRSSNRAPGGDRGGGQSSP